MARRLAVADAIGIYLTVLALAFLAGTGHPIRADEALNAQTGALIDSAQRAVESGQYARAAATLAPAIEDARVPPELMARAFLLRGIANAETGRTVAALSDFANALWLDTLPTGERARAHLHRARLHLGAGRREAGEADLRAALRLAPDDPEIQALARSEGLSANPEATGATGSLGLPERLNSAGEAGGKAPQGGFSVQLGALGDMAAAAAAWRRISTAHPDLLAGLGPHFEVAGGAGRGLIRLRAGPLASLRQSQDLCDRLRERGQDCFAPAP